VEVFRISKKAYSQIDGIGGLLYPGRWHIAGYRVIYTAQYRSLAALESLVHLSQTHLLANDFVLTSIKIPDNIDYKTIEHKKLSTNWNSIHQIAETQKIGTDFLKLSKYLFIKVPSAVIEHEYNFIINPQHKDFEHCKVISQSNFNFDGRLHK
jgi:RES domain-containing protein